MADVRVADTDDLAAVMKIERAAHAYPWSEKIMLRYLQKKDAVWILEEDNQHLAHAVVSLVLDEAELLMITVAPEFQRRGFGKQLLSMMMNKLQAAGATCLFLEVRASNTPAILLYEGLGFAETGRRRGYYPTPSGREDALLFSIELID
ncbi:ribosomal protein S18-alanine N-acetyltransferase [Thalassolituus sp.]|jgi:ribosomal-protein-alanine N-acetyltransferase|uniref:ribosomal protein S18-alanine N-acetyltransferase n=1 Tax=Thalassolituus sp. TaxID=2030822 RepID=UPI0035197A0A